MKRALMITTVAPYPKDVGKQVVLGGFCDYFQDRNTPVQLRVLSFESLPQGLDNGAACERLPKPGLWRKLWNALWHSMLLQNKSLQEAFFWSPAALRQMAAVIQDFAPHLVIFDTLRVGQYRPALAGGHFSVLYLDDLFSLRYARLLETMERFPGVAIDALGNFAKNIPRAFLSLYRVMPVLQRVLLRCERVLIARAENTQPRHFDLALLINADEVKHLRARTGMTNLRAIRPYLVPDRPPPERQWNGDATFVFMGSLNLPHNGFSIERFVSAQLHKLASTVPGFRLLVIGNHASDTLQKLAEENPDHLSLLGFVEDADAVIAGCAGMLVPLLFGSGVKIKVIDALRLGVPVVATAVGSEGIVADGLRGLIVENDIGRFARRCRKLLDPQVNAEHSRASRELFDDNYAAGSVARQYDDCFQVRAGDARPGFRPAATSPRPL